MKPDLSLIPEPDRSTEPRGAMTDARKRRIHASRGGKCWMCGLPVPVTGPEVRYDHRVPLELTGTDNDSNLWPLHREPCDKLKTAADKTAIARSKRLAGETCTAAPARPLQGRGFEQRNRKFNGKLGPTQKALRQAANEEAGLARYRGSDAPKSPPTGKGARHG